MTEETDKSLGWNWHQSQHCSPPLTHVLHSQTHCRSAYPGVGGTELISSISLFFPFLTNIKTMVAYWISCSYWTGVTTAEVAPVQYEHDLKIINIQILISKIFIADKFAKRALVTSTQLDLIWVDLVCWWNESWAPLFVHTSELVLICGVIFPFKFCSVRCTAVWEVKNSIT